MKPNNSHKFAHLDGLRGLAALFVVFHHFAYGFYPTIKTGNPDQVHGRFDLWIANSPLNVLFAGDFAVSIFFVLSGFVLSYKFFDTGDRDAITSGGIRRYFRLMPPILGSVIAAYLLLRLGLFFNQPAAALTHSEWLGSFWHFSASLRDALYQGLFGALFKGEASYNVNLWTMQAEFIGSYLVFLILAVFGKIRNRGFIYAFLGLALWNTFYLAFLIGVVLSDLWTSPYRDRVVNYVKARWIPLLGAGLLLGAIPDRQIPSNVLVLLQPGWMQYAQFSQFSHVLAGSLIVLGVLSLPKLQAPFNTRVVQYLGRISFSVYVLHLLVIGSFSSYLFVHLPQALPYGVRFLITFIPSMVILFLWSGIFTRHLDQPAIRLSGKLYRKFFGKPEPPAPKKEPAMKPAPEPAPAERPAISPS